MAAPSFQQSLTSKILSLLSSFFLTTSNPSVDPIIQDKNLGRYLDAPLLKFPIYFTRKILWFYLHISSKFSYQTKFVKI